MNITALRPRFIRYLEPLADGCIRLGITPNQVSLISLLFGFLCAYLYYEGRFVAGSAALFISAVLDLVDGSVARKVQKESDFGAVIDWVFDKYVDAFVLLGLGLGGLPVISHLIDLSFEYRMIADFGVVALAIIGSMMNTFIKPVVYAEVGFSERLAGKINDPLEGVGFFGRPETLILLIVGGVTGYIWVAVLLIAFCTNLSAVQRIAYLYRRLS
ncbi:MAG: CDP-alcohol phosphatidyltransferase family protein [Methanomicrobiaceae archaeon]|nr:CDP-alcohol phosphatidyltransferase family protein [Methanomicrobiaceae archaeon]